jgi:hypothetical protein
LNIYFILQYEPKSRPPFSEVIERLSTQLQTIEEPAPSRPICEPVVPVPEALVDCKPSHAVLGARSVEAIMGAEMVAAPESRATVTASASRKRKCRGFSITWFC